MTGSESLRHVRKTFASNDPGGYAAAVRGLAKRMATIKDFKLAEKRVLAQKQVVSDLDTLVKDIDRCEKTIHDLKSELERVNQRHADRKTTRDDIAYLTDLLKCANRKLAWEKQLASLQKRTPALLETMSSLINDPQNPPDDATRAAMLRALQGVQAAMERLQNVKIS